MTLSRFFNWVGSFKNFLPFFTFLSKVHSFRRRLAGQIDEDDNEEEPGEQQPSEQSGLGEAARKAYVQNRQQVQDELVTCLKNMRAKKSTLDVAHMVLGDPRVKFYSHLFPGQ